MKQERLDTAPINFRKGIIMKRKIIAAAAVLAMSSAAQAQLSGPNRIGIGSSPGTFQSPSSSSTTTTTPGTTGTGQSVSSDALPRPGQSTGNLGTFGTQERINSTLPDTTPTLPNISPSLPDITSPSRQIENPAGVFRNAPTPSSGVLPQTGAGSVDATSGGLDPFGSPTLHRSDQMNGIGSPASGEIGNERGRLTPAPDVVPNPRPLGSAATLEGQPPTPVNTDTTDMDRSALSGGPQAPKVGGHLNTTGVNTPPAVPQEPLDQALAAKIRAQLSQTPVGAKPVIRLDAETIRDMRITSQNGRVVLEGFVNTPQERQLAELRAREIQGVAAIDNRLKVRNKSMGAPAAGQSGQSQSTPASGQSKQNSSDLNDEHSDVTPDR
jgi:hypothetical protein